MHVSKSALEPDEPDHNILPFPRARICMHATHESDEPSAPSALAYSMACSMAQAGDSNGDCGIIISGSSDGGDGSGNNGNSSSSSRCNGMYWYTLS